VPRDANEGTHKGLATFVAYQSSCTSSIGNLHFVPATPFGCTPACGALLAASCHSLKKEACWAWGGIGARRIREAQMHWHESSWTLVSRRETLCFQVFTVAPFDGGL